MVDPVVTVQEGELRGKVSTAFDSNDFYSFQGIPYAKPPLGPLRFKAPKPPEKWDGILDATKDGNECYAKNNTHFPSENCLFINVFTKKIGGDKLKPVMFWIHGGGFTTGSSHSVIYGPEYLMMYDIVLVTFNYRLGILGFLSFEDSTLGIPGNAGLKDMVMALKWVQINIKIFSGDPNNVTIFGESAGGTAVQLLMLSPMSKGLFHKAISQSGSVQNSWARGKKSTVYTLAEALGIQSNDQNVILRHLQEMTIEQLYSGISKLEDMPYVGKIRPFGLVIEKASLEPCFLSEEPVNIIKSGKYHKVPLISGYCSREGMFVYKLCKNAKGQQFLIDESIVPFSMNLRIGSNEYNSIVKSIKDFYFADKDPLENIDDIFRLYTDNSFSVDIYNTARYFLETGNSPIYFYRFSLDTPLNFMKSLLSITDPGACHGDDISYIFKTGFAPEDIEPGSSEFIGIHRMTKLWTNFAIYGHPTPNTQDKLLSVTWQPLEIEKYNYLEIGEDLEINCDPEKESMDFWNDLFKRTSISKSKL